MDDLVFGALSFVPGEVSYWEKLEYLELLDTTVPLRVYADAEGLTEDQKNIYLTFKEGQLNLRADLQESLFAFYQVQREIYADVYAEICNDTSLGLREEDFVPVLKTSDQIWGILMPCQWIINQNGEKPETVILWHGSWDIEHEFSTHFQKTKLLGIEAMGGVFYGYPPPLIMAP